MDSVENTNYQGSCLCRAVRYEVTAEIKAVSHCHCSMCRKAHGAAFATYGSVPRGAHSFLAGEDKLRHYRSSAAVTRSFCSACGSQMLWQSEGQFADWVSFPLGSLDTPFVTANQKHIHVESKAPWLELDEKPLRDDSHDR